MKQTYNKLSQDVWEFYDYLCYRYAKTDNEELRKLIDKYVELFGLEKLLNDNEF